ncbi:MAG: type II toxin-antitoxin system VapC family toxin [Propionibacteriaceae bacterium]|jgi:PIN domain nuclease of toxin-antitoxin system|nr:type II toxin-antitoxin system VapC family toxin [Propionibacteriaceae bacterium]
MRYLADTHILIWALNLPKRLPKAVRKVLQTPGNEICFSPVSIWEISIKHSLGKLSLNGHTPEEFWDAVVASGFRPVSPSLAAIASSYRLPRRHLDPFDRMLIWQAIDSGMTLLTAESKAADYTEDGLRVIS